MGSEANGTGRLVFRNGEMEYNGEWKNHKPHGQGTEKFRDGSYYTGLFVNGLKHGHGTFRWANGDLYVGNFCQGDIEGQGVQKLVNGDIYEGDFRRSRRWGQGTMTNSHGRYVGQFVNDRKSGYGEFYWSGTNKVYKGMFKNGQISGKG